MTNFDIQHGKVTTVEAQEDGTIKIETETFYEGNLAGFKREIEKSTMVDRQTVLKQIIEDISIKARTITITIHKDNVYEPARVVCKWLEIEDKLGKLR